MLLSAHFEVFLVFFLYVPYSDRYNESCSSALFNLFLLRDRLN